jgi:hypothetical protein
MAATLTESQARVLVGIDDAQSCVVVSRQSQTLAGNRNMTFTFTQGLMHDGLPLWLVLGFGAAAVGLAVVAWRILRK